MDEREWGKFVTDQVIRIQNHSRRELAGGTNFFETLTSRAPQQTLTTCKK